MRLFNYLRGALPVLCVAVALVAAACAHVPPVSTASTPPSAWAFQWSDGVQVSASLPQAVLANGHAQDARGGLH
ncbi:MAG: hypothetical protein ACRD3W_14410, partial [Terriglobales bacterium]